MCKVVLENVCLSSSYIYTSFRKLVTYTFASGITTLVELINFECNYVNYQPEMLN